ncbi:MAG: hypothetical protein IKE10_01965 [Bacilli bacterium]|nr:hypothetical protein [Bacilli bacterium]
MNKQFKNWKDYKKYKNQHDIFGMYLGYISTYDDELIERLRNIYYGGIPASVCLLSHDFASRKPAQMTKLLSRAFLDDENTRDVRILTVVNNSSMNSPKAKNYSVLERTTINGITLIYDTTAGLVYDKDAYLRLEEPIVVKEEEKDSIEKTIEEDKEKHPTDYDINPCALTIVLPMIEDAYNNTNERYSQNDSKLLQREVKLCKDKMKKSIKQRRLIPKTKKETEQK